MGRFAKMLRIFDMVSLKQSFRPKGGIFFRFNCILKLWEVRRKKTMKKKKQSASQKIIAKVMHEFKDGELHIGKSTNFNTVAKPITHRYSKNFTSSLTKVNSGVKFLKSLD
jgi:hypothetical protein